MLAKNQNDFKDMSHVDAVAMVINTAVVARQSSHPVQVNESRVGNRDGIIIWIPGYTMQDGNILPVKNEKDTATMAKGMT